MLSHPSTSDELRVEVDAKVLKSKQKYLSAIPSTKEDMPLKRQVSKELDELLDAIVLLHKPDELGWKLYLEGRDCEDMGTSRLDPALMRLKNLCPGGYPREQVQEYIQLFPTSPLATLFRGYFTYKNEALFDDDDDEPNEPLDDPLDAVLVSIMPYLVN